MTPSVVITALPRLPPRAPDSHKGTFGRVLIVAGSRGMSGAAILAGLGALRGGAGLVQVATPREVLPIVAGYSPCYLTAALLHDADGQLAADAAAEILELARHAQVLGIGPGLGQSDAVLHVVRTVLAQSSMPVVLDADGLNVLAKFLTDAALPKRQAPLILTPHPGEFARLARASTTAVQDQREALAVGFAAAQKVVLVLKGHESLVTDGKRLYRNTTGNPGMATGGSGDVLTGLIAALLAQRLEPFEAAQLAVYLHGLAGDLAAEVRGQASLIATDLVDYLPAAFAKQVANA
jgi:ADP-dependent NAD(P)H-hydrate dehydratase